MTRQKKIKNYFNEVISVTVPVVINQSLSGLFKLPFLYMHYT